MMNWSKYGAVISTVSLAVALYSVYFPTGPIIGGLMTCYPLVTEEGFTTCLDYSGTVLWIAMITFFIGLGITFRKKLRGLW